MTYETAAEAEADRKQQRALLLALNAWDRALRRDDCGAWCISGTRGSVHTWGDGVSWALYGACRSARHWTATKARLSFCAVTLDGDEEGCLRLQQLPTAAQANVIRDALGIRKRVEFGAEDLARRRASMKSMAQAVGRANATSAVSEPV